MTGRQFEQRLVKGLQGALSYLRDTAPYDTGNLSLNAIKLEHVGVGKWRLYVDENIAPYMVFTNETWTQKNHYGHQNPNLHWWNSAAEVVIQYLKQYLSML